MMQKLLIVFLFLGIGSCGSPKKPQEVLTQPQLAALLVDIYMAEARLDKLPIAKDSSIRFFVPFEQKMLQAKGIPDSILRKTYSYYLANPKEREQIYDSVIDTLTLREQVLSRGPRPTTKTPEQQIQK